MLHGAGGSETDWIVKGGIQQTADALMPKGKLDNYLIVMPTIGSHSWYVDSDETKLNKPSLTSLFHTLRTNTTLRPKEKSRCRWIIYGWLWCIKPCSQSL